MDPHRRRRPLLGAAALVVLAAAGCVVPDPPTAVPNDDLAVPSVQPRWRDVAYGPAGGCGDPRPSAPRAPGGSDETCGGSQTLDVYPRRAGRARGTLVYVHGGGFTTGDKVTVGGPRVAAQLERGYDLVSVNYRLVVPAPAPTTTSTTVSTPTSTTSTSAPTTAVAPASSPAPAPAAAPLAAPAPCTPRAPAPRNAYPTAVADVGTALCWLRAHGAAYGLDTSRLVLVGSSSGGAVAALVATAWNSPDPVLSALALPRVDRLVTVAGIWDFERAGPASRRYAGTWADAPTTAAQRTAMSPLTWLDPADPPAYVLHGDQDPVVEPANALLVLLAARRSGSVARVDVVDHDAAGTPMDHLSRWHLPLGGANRAVLEAFLDGA